MTNVLVFMKQATNLWIVIVTFALTYLGHTLATPIVSFKASYNIQCEKLRQSLSKDGWL